MIKVCDAIMGAGKSSAAITYMNENPSQKFIYITPYLEEARRIKENCPRLHFIEPSGKLEKYHYKKTLHTEKLIQEGRNITTTHSAFKRYTKEMLEQIREQGYILFIDENVDILENLEVDPFDLQVVREAGYVIEDGNRFRLSDKEYKGLALKYDLFDLAKSRDLVRIDNDDNKFYYWILTPDLLTSFKDVFILTYLFEGQSICHFIKINKLSYSMIGVENGEDGVYRFVDYPGKKPDYVRTLKDRIHILDNYKMNNIGNDKYALSINWFQKDKSDVKQLKNNIDNCFNNIWRKESSKKKLWGTYKVSFNQLKGKGYTKSHLNFNTKATNSYKDRNCLVYAVNVFMNANEKVFYHRYGVEVDEDVYALSIMVQWIWRSAIREGNDIYIYIPSRRMRNLLTDWINSISQEGND